MNKTYQSGLEFLNEGPCVEQAKEVRDLCFEVAENTPMDVSVVRLAFMLMEMYNRGRNEGATAALIHMEPSAQEVL